MELELLAEEVMQEIIKRNMTISTAESCTGGMLSSYIVGFAGASKAFLEGCVTYSNEAKMHRLGVKSETLEKYGAVSEQTAGEMSEGIRKTAKTDIGLSTTGIAGPDGGTKEKPVGLVYIGISIKDKTFIKRLQLDGNRQQVREQVVFIILNELKNELQKTED